MKMMVVKQFKFEAAHNLPGYNGKCSNIHGHSYLLEIGVEGFVNSKTGMVMDFSRLKEITSREIVDILDHAFLNDLRDEPGELGINFPWEMPTAENMVDWIVLRLINRWDGTREGGEIIFVRLWETSTSYVEWRNK